MSHLHPICIVAVTMGKIAHTSLHGYYAFSSGEGHDQAELIAEVKAIIELTFIGQVLQCMNAYGSNC